MKKIVTLGCVLFLTLPAAPAWSASLDWVDAVYYSYTFETANGGLTLIEYPVFNEDEQQIGWEYRASEWPGNGSYYATLSFGFYHHAATPVDLDGTQHDIASLLLSPPEGIEEAWWWAHEPSFGNPSGTLTFGAGNQIVDWNFRTHDFLGEGRHHWSEPVMLDEDYLSYFLDDPSLFLDREVYGVNISPPANYIFASKVGRWVSSVEHVCIPVDGTGGHPEAGRCQDPALALVPLPAPLALLLSGLAGLVALRRLPGRQPAGEASS